MGSLRRRLYEVLDVGSGHDWTSRWLHRLLVALILLSVAAVVASTVPALDGRFHRLFIAIEVVSAGVFTLEYLARLWVAVEHPPLRREPPWRARLMHAASPGMVVDAVSVAPVLLSLFVTEDLGVFLVFRLFRFFKLGRYSPGMASLLETIHQERRALLACLIILGGLVVVSAALMHMAEATAQPERFGSIPDAMWWAIVTLTTVGYGDAVPLTPTGKVIAGVTALFGLVMLALPVGIVATSFTEVIHRRDFVVTWAMVARVPIFADLDAASIAEIMRIMHSQMADVGEIITHRGDEARCMYFVAGGEVEVERGSNRLRLGAGQFFGELALVQQSHRAATVTVTSRAKLLVLDALDLHALMDRRPELGTRIRRAMLPGHGAEPVEAEADLAAAEVSEREPAPQDEPGAHGHRR